MRVHLAPLAIVPLLAVGCAQVASTIHPDVHAASLVLSSRISGGGLRTQSVVNPYDTPDIDHLLVQLFTSSGSVETPVTSGGATFSVDLTQDSLGNPIVFSNLRDHTTYRVRGWAYSAAGTAASSLISSDSSYVDMALVADDRPTTGTLPIYMIDRSFAATSSVRITLDNAGGAPVDHVEATLYKVTLSGDVAVAGATASIPAASLPSTLMVGSLGPNATYKLLVSAQASTSAEFATQSVSITTTNETSAATASVNFVFAAG